MASLYKLADVISASFAQCKLEEVFDPLSLQRLYHTPWLCSFIAVRIPDWSMIASCPTRPNREVPMISALDEECGGWRCRQSTFFFLVCNSTSPRLTPNICHDAHRNTKRCGLNSFTLPKSQWCSDSNSRSQPGTS